MARVVDLTESDGDFVVLGRSVVLPSSTVDSQPSPLNGALRWNPDVGAVQVYNTGTWITMTGSFDTSNNTHTHAISQIINLQTTLDGKLSTTDIGTTAGKLVALDSGAKIPAGLLPAISITDIYPVASQAAMLALTAQRGDIAVRTDISKTFVLATENPDTLADWIELQTGAGISSIAGLTGPTITASALVAAFSTVTDALYEPKGKFSGINPQTASYTLVLSDAGKMIELDNAAALSLTVPLNASVAYPIGARIDLLQYGVGQVTVVATGGVTIRSSGSKMKLSGQYSGASLYKRGTDEWVLIGDLVT